MNPHLRAIHELREAGEAALSKADITQTERTIRHIRLAVLDDIEQRAAQIAAEDQ